MRAVGILTILLDNGYSVSYASTWLDHEYTEALFSTELRFMGVEVFPDVTPDKWPLLEMADKKGSCRFDYVVVARRNVAEQALPAINQRCPNIPVIFDTVDVHFVRETRQKMVELQQENAARDAGLYDLSTEGVLKWLDSSHPEAAPLRIHRDKELDVVSSATVTWVVSNDDRDLIKHFLPKANVQIVSNIMPMANHESASCLDRHGIIFVGSFGHQPNPQAIKHFFKEVLPEIFSELPLKERKTVHVHIVGSGTPPKEIEKLIEDYGDVASLHVNLPGPQLKLLFARSKVMVAPLLVGAGVKGKINQAMYHGVPVVAYKIALEGMHLQHEHDVLVAQDVHDFAVQTTRLFLECDLWIRLSEGGLKVIRQHFTREVAEVALLETFEALGQPKFEHTQRKCITNVAV